MTPEEYLVRVRELLPGIRARAAQTEKLRRLPDESFTAFQQHQLLRALQPKRFGGFELDPGIFYQAVTEIAAVCGSTGWVFAVLGAHNWHLAIFPPQAQQDVWGDDNAAVLCTSLAPTGTVERVAGGFRLRGRWSFSSGCDFCQWAVLGGLTPADGGGSPDARLFLVPRAEYRIEDNWHVTGLCGTGSKDLVVDDAFVPEYRSHSYLDASHLRHPGTEINDAPLYRLPFSLVFRYGITAPAIGVALGALETFREQSGRRINQTTQSRSAEDPFIQQRLAESAAEIGAGYERMLGNFTEMMRRVRAGEEIPLEQRARYRWDAGKAIAWSVRGVDRLFEASGGRGIFLDNPIQRAWRDVLAMRAHAGNTPEHGAMVFARSELGLPPTDIRF